jgi:hypothetical protein
MSFIRVTKSAINQAKPVPVMINLRYVEHIEPGVTSGTVIRMHHPLSNYDLHVDESFATVSCRIETAQSAPYANT